MRPPREEITWERNEESALGAQQGRHEKEQFSPLGCTAKEFFTEIKEEMLPLKSPLSPFRKIVIAMLQKRIACGREKK